MKYFIYCRKSTESEEKQALSIEAQLTELREYAKREGLYVAREFTETKTAKEPGRPVFNQMMAELEQGVVEGILAWNPDRLARNSIDGGKVIFLVDTGKIKSLKFPTFWFEPTPQGKFMLSVAFGQAKYYTDNLRENVLRGIRQKLRRGELPAKAPLGYLNEPRLRTIVPDPKAFLKVKKCLELFALGEHGLTALQRKMFSLGLVARTGKSLHLATIYDILTNPFYYGMMKHKGEMYQGSHKPMISKKLFDKIQLALVDNSKPRKKRDRGFLFLHFAKCGNCGYMMTAEQHIKKSGLRFVYYRCTKKSKVKICNQHRFLREEKFAEQVKQYVQKVSLPDVWRNRFSDKLANWEKDGRHTSELFVQNLKVKISKVKAKMSRLLDAHLEGLLELDEFQAKKNTLLEQKADLQGKLKDFEQKGNHWVELTRNWILASNQAKNLASTENFHEMKNFLKKIGSNRVIQDQQLCITFKKPWNYLAETIFSARARRAAAANTEMWACVDLNHRPHGCEPCALTT